jgi:hypothetical protein
MGVPTQRHHHHHPHQWPPQLLLTQQQQHQQPFPSPPASSISDQGQPYPPFYAERPPPHRLNMSGLNVSIPGAQLSPISAASTSTALSPNTPISPNGGGGGGSGYVSYEPSPYETHPPPLPHTSRSSSVSSSSLRRKRSLPFEESSRASTPMDMGMGYDGEDVDEKPGSMRQPTAQNNFVSKLYAFVLLSFPFSCDETDFVQE